MIPARDRLTLLRVYDSKADMLSDSNYTDYSDGIVSGTARIERTYFSMLPAFASCNASMFECEVNFNVDLTGKWVRVASEAFATDAATLRTTYWLFAGRIDSCKYDSRQATRKLVAYDEMLQLRGLDVSDWWKTYWTTAAASVNASVVVGAMCTNFGVTLSGTFTTDFAIKKAGVANLGGCSFAQMLAYVGQIIGAVFYINENGVLTFDYVSAVIAGSGTAVDSNVDTNQSEFEDTNTSAFGSIMVYEGSDVVYSNGNASPTYVVRDNALSKGQTTAELSTTYGVTYAALGGVTGIRGGKIVLITSCPDEDFSKRVRFVTVGNVKYLVSGVVFSGAQMIEQTLTCTAELQSDSYSPAQIAAANDMTALGIQMTFKVNADEVIEAVNLEATGGVTINAEALNINGVVSANNGFKVNLDGSMEATAGKIGGWNIQNIGLSKSYQHDGYEDAILLSSDMTNGRAFVAEKIRLSDEQIMSSAIINGDGVISTRGINGGIFLYGGSIIRAGEDDYNCAKLSSGSVKVCFYDEEQTGDVVTKEVTAKSEMDGYAISREFRQKDYDINGALVNDRRIALTMDAWEESGYSAVGFIALEENNGVRKSSKQNADGLYILTSSGGVLVEVSRNRIHQGKRYSTGTNSYHDYDITEQNETIEMEHKIVSNGVQTEYYHNTQHGGKGQYEQTVNGAYNKTLVNPYGVTVYTPQNTESVKIRNNYVSLRDRIFGTCNIVDMASLEQGGIGSNGQETVTVYSLRCGYVKVNANTTYTESWSGISLRPYVFFYNSSKAFISYTQITSNLVTSGTFTTPSNCAYVRISWDENYDRALTPSMVTTLQLEKGSSASSFVQYAMDNVELTERCRSWKYCGDITSNGKAYIPDYAQEIGLLLKISTYTFPIMIYIRDTLTQTTNVCDYYEGANAWLKFYFNYQSSLGYVEKNNLTSVGSGWGDWHMYVYAK